jgi:hypothetical protein
MIASVTAFADSFEGVQAPDIFGLGVEDVERLTAPAGRLP